VILLVLFCYYICTVMLSNSKCSVCLVCSADCCCVLGFYLVSCG